MDCTVNLFVRAWMKLVALVAGWIKEIKGKQKEGKQKPRENLPERREKTTVLSLSQSLPGMKQELVS